MKLPNFMHKAEFPNLMHNFVVNMIQYCCYCCTEFITGAFCFVCATSLNIGGAFAPAPPRSADSAPMVIRKGRVQTSHLVDHCKIYDLIKPA